MASNYPNNNQSNSNNNTHSNSSITFNRIAHRTRSKCQLTDYSIVELEKNLPDDLLVEPIDENTIWFTFLENLNQADGLPDDENDDPDFPDIALECDFDNEPGNIYVPKKEAYELVQEAVEFCGGDIFTEERQKNANKSNLNDKEKPNESINFDFTFNNLNSTINTALSNDLNNGNNNENVEAQQQQEKREINNIRLELSIACGHNDSVNAEPSTVDTTTSIAESNQTDESSKVTTAYPLSNSQVCVKTDYIPRFNEEQTKQLDEQLRNNLFNEMDGYLSKSCTRPFEILNLKEAIKIVDKAKDECTKDTSTEATTPSSTVSTLDQSMSSKYLETILDSPVFYNLNLLPTCKYKYQSQFTKAQFTVPELRLLVLGYDQFKHLRKTECAECIKEHLLPTRTRDEIFRKITDMLKSEDRKVKALKILREPLPKLGLDFNKEEDYKPPIDKCESHTFSGMYTMAIERLKMAKLLKERKEYDKTRPPEATKRRLIAKRPAPTDVADESDEPEIVSVIAGKSINVESSASVNRANTPVSSSARNRTRNFMIPSAQTAVSLDSSTFTANTSITSNSDMSMIIQPTTPIIVNANNMNTARTLQMTMPVSSNAFTTNIANNIIRVLNTTDLNRFMSPVNIPNGFQGTILFQPHIHIHADVSGLQRYREIIPKTKNNTTSLNNNNNNSNGNKKRKL